MLAPVYCGCQDRYKFLLPSVRILGRIRRDGVPPAPNGAQPQAFCNRWTTRHPDRLTATVRKQERKGRVFLDFLRNAYAQNTVAPYAVRALPGAPVATPLDWDELGAAALHAQAYTPKNIFRRMGQKDDP